MHQATADLAATTGEDRPVGSGFRVGTRWHGGSLTDLGDVTGIDLAPAAIEHAKQEFAGVHLVAGSLDEAPLTGPFDVVISSEVLAHVDDRRRTSSGSRTCCALVGCSC